MTMKTFKSLCGLLCTLFLQTWTQNAFAQSSDKENISIDQTNFPDADFRFFVRRYDLNEDRMLSSGERDILQMECDGLGIHSLEGIQYFSVLEHLDCSNNQISSIDLSYNTYLTHLNLTNNQISILDLSDLPDLIQLYCSNNQLASLNLKYNPNLRELVCRFNQLASLDLSYNSNLVMMYCDMNQLPVTLDEKNRIDISILPGFEPYRASNFTGASLDGNFITFFQQEITYSYATAYTGNDTSFEAVTFTLVADRDPSVANESIEAEQGRVYANERTLYTEGIEGMVSVFNPAGGLVYQGAQNRIPVKHPGLYILRHGNHAWKILVM